jgi:hypothetical protein
MTYCRSSPTLLELPKGRSGSVVRSDYNNDGDLDVLLSGRESARVATTLARSLTCVTQHVCVTEQLL